MSRPADIQPARPAATERAATVAASVATDDQWEEFFYGAVNGESRVVLRFAGDNFNVEADGQYDLTGLETYLPAPLQKSFGEGWQFRFSLNGQNDDYAITGNIDDRANFEGEWQLDNAGWQKATLTVGNDNETLC